MNDTVGGYITQIWLGIDQSLGYIQHLNLEVQALVIILVAWLKSRLDESLHVPATTCLIYSLFHIAGTRVPTPFTYICIGPTLRPKREVLLFLQVL